MGSPRPDNPLAAKRYNVVVVAEQTLCRLSPRLLLTLSETIQRLQQVICRKWQRPRFAIGAVNRIRVPACLWYRLTPTDLCVRYKSWAWVSE